VVTPSASPSEAPSRMSSKFAVSKKTSANSYPETCDPADGS
jgi:hypothetical protein